MRLSPTTGQRADVQKRPTTGQRGAQRCWLNVAAVVGSARGKIARIYRATEGERKCNESFGLIRIPRKAPRDFAILVSTAALCSPRACRRGEPESRTARPRGMPGTLPGMPGNARGGRWGEQACPPARRCRVAGQASALLLASSPCFFTSSERRAYQREAGRSEGGQEGKG